VQAGESVDIAIGVAHRMAAPAENGVTFIEVQTGTYFGEDDIVRLEDDFGRN
jgi:mannose-6-phosphate isomerase